VPQVDADGNEAAGVPTVERLAPLATYTPWSLRAGYPAATRELVDFLGTFVPFPRTEAERRERNDPRPSLEARYGTRARYLDAARRAAESLVARGLLLAEDAPRAVDRAGVTWDWIMQR
jgi:hypothetical protein